MKRLKSYRLIKYHYDIIVGDGFLYELTWIKPLFFGLFSKEVKSKVLVYSIVIDRKNYESRLNKMIESN